MKGKIPKQKVFPRSKQRPVQIDFKNYFDFLKATIAWQMNNPQKCQVHLFSFEINYHQKKQKIQQKELNASIDDGEGVGHHWT